MICEARQIINNAAAMLRNAPLIPDKADITMRNAGLNVYKARRLSITQAAHINLIGVEIFKGLGSAVGSNVLSSNRKLMVLINSTLCRWQITMNELHK
jgi:hypothetical protein